MHEASFPQPDHDHGSCVGEALSRAESVCHIRRARLTPLRRRVLELVWTSHEAVGAYALLAQMGDQERRPAPITVYRALDFLQAHGLIHRVESLNAYVGCSAPGETHVGQFLICRGCRTVAEIQDLPLQRAIETLGRAHGFVIESPRVELEGLCHHCHNATQTP